MATVSKILTYDDADEAAILAAGAALYNSDGVGIVDSAFAPNVYGTISGGIYNPSGIIDNIGGYFPYGILDGSGTPYANGIFDGTTYYYTGIFDGTTYYYNGIFDGTDGTNGTHYLEGVLLGGYYTGTSTVYIPDTTTFPWDGYGVYYNISGTPYYSPTGIIDSSGNFATGGILDQDGVWNQTGILWNDGITLAYSAGGIFDGATWFLTGIFDGTTYYYNGIFDGADGTNGTHYLEGVLLGGYYTGTSTVYIPDTTTFPWDGYGVYYNISGTPYYSPTGIIDSSGNFATGGILDQDGVWNQTGILWNDGITLAYSAGGIFDGATWFLTGIFDGTTYYYNGIFDGADGTNGTQHTYGIWDGASRLSVGIYDSMGGIYTNGILDSSGVYWISGIIDPMGQISSGPAIVDLNGYNQDSSGIIDADGYARAFGIVSMGEGSGIKTFHNDGVLEFDYLGNGGGGATEYFSLTDTTSTPYQTGLAAAPPGSDILGTGLL